MYWRVSSFKKKINEFSFVGISIPWGDVCSAYHSTGIPNIVVYLGLQRFIFKFRKLLLPGIKLFSSSFFNNLIQRIVKNTVTGPNEKKRETSHTIVWGEVSDGKKEIFEAYRFPEGYKLTALGSADILQRILNNSVKPGTTTPSLAFGADYMDKFIIEKEL